jgi:hypothetical protein
MGPVLCHKNPAQTVVSYFFSPILSSGFFLNFSILLCAYCMPCAGHRPNNKWQGKPATKDQWRKSVTEIKRTHRLVQILDFWTLSIVLSLSKTRPVYFSKHNVSEIGFCLRLQVKPTQLGPIDGANPYLRASLRNFVFWKINRTGFR